MNAKAPIRPATVERPTAVPESDEEEPTLRPLPRRRLADLRQRFPRGHLLVLALILLAGLLRGGFWMVSTEIWNPMDETHHFTYVESIATGHGIPTVGKDRISPDSLGLLKDTPTLFYRAQAPYDHNVDNDAWGSMREQYEAIQPPLYYALMAPAYVVSRPFGLLTSVYAVRLASILLALTAIPLTWLLAKELFPRHPAAWLAAPAVLITLQGFNMNLGSITNDALVVPMAALALLAVARAWQGLTYKRAVLAGLALGGALLAKSTTVGLIPLMAVPLLWMIVTRRQPLTKVLTWSLVLGATAAVVVVPWLAWNQLTYGALTASQALNDIRTGGWVRDSLSADAVAAHFRRARMGLWDGQLRGMGYNTYTRIFEGALVVACVAGVTVSLWRRRAGEAGWLLWTALALPLAFVGMEAISFLVFKGGGEPYGRHLYFALVPACVVIAAGLVVALGSRWGMVAVLVVMVLAFGREQIQVRHYVADVYESGVLAGGLTPVVDQSLNEYNVAAQRISADPPCPVKVVGLLVLDQPPDSIEIREGSAFQTARYAGTTDPSFDEMFGGGQGKISLYLVDRPLIAPFDLRLPTAHLMGGSSTVDSPRVRFEDRAGHPVSRLYCQVDDAADQRFRQLYGPYHPSQVTRAGVLAWPTAWWVISIMALMMAIIYAAVPRWLPGRRRLGHSAPAADAPRRIRTSDQSANGGTGTKP
jgi:hypothetical protein